MALNFFGNTSTANKPTAFAFPSVPTATSSAAPSAFTFGGGGANATAPLTNVFGATSSAAAPTIAAGSGGLFSSFGQTSTAVPPPQQSIFSFGGTSAAPSSFFGTSNTMPTMAGATGFQLGVAPKFGQSTTNQPQFGGTFNFQTTGLQQQQPQQQVPAMQMNVSEIANFFSSLTNPPIYGDERDGIIAKFNQLQAFCGFGRGFYNNASAPIDYKPSNPFCRLKTICYNRLEGTKDEDGLISFIMKQPEKNIKANLQLIIDEIFKLLGSKTNISVHVEATKTLPDDKTELVIYITETGIMGVRRRILASESYAYFNQPNIRQQLTNNLAVEQILLKTMLPLDRMNEYLSNPQDGIDLLIWNQAVTENPDPKRLIPYAILGFEQLKERQKLQKIERGVHDACTEELTRRLENLEERIVLKQAKLDELKNSQYKVYHRLLTVIGRYFAQTRRNYSFEPNEENLKSGIDAINAQLNGPAQLKVMRALNRLAEIASNLNVLSRTPSTIPLTTTALVDEEPLDEDLLLEIKQFLRKSQDTVDHLTQTLKKNQEDIGVIQNVLIPPTT